VLGVGPADGEVQRACAHELLGLGGIEFKVVAFAAFFEYVSPLSILGKGHANTYRPSGPQKRGTRSRCRFRSLRGQIGAALPGYHLSKGIARNVYCQN
jgi:hypothetical protein